MAHGNEQGGPADSIERMSTVNRTVRKFGTALLALGMGVLALGVNISVAQEGGPAGGLDQAYGFAGVGQTPLSATLGDRFQTAAVGKDGKTYAAGFVTETGTDQAMAVARITPDGALDTTFDADGFAVLNAAPGRGSAELARGLGVQSDGKVVMSGQAESTAPGADPADLDIYVSRFDTNGALDPSFGGDGTLEINLSPGAVNPATGRFRTDQSYGLTVLPSDKIVLVAARGPDPVARPGRADRDFAIIQLTEDGALDPSFGADPDTDGITFVNTRGVINGVEEDLNESPRQALVQSDGKIVQASYSEGSDDSAHVRVIRYLSNGDLDPSFGTGGIATAPLLGDGARVAEAYDIGIQANKYVIAGYGGDTTTAKVDLIAARFDSKGEWDTSFGDNGLVRVDIAGDDDRARDLVVLPNGRVLMAGSGKPSSTDINGMMVMLTRHGKLDGSFGRGGILMVDLGGPNDSFFGVALAPNKKKAFVSGWRGESPASGDNARVARVRF